MECLPLQFLTKIKKIFVSRDRMGIKPLYFFSNGEFIYFGSEIRPLKFFNRLTPDKKI